MNPIYRDLEQLVCPHQPLSSQMRRLDDALDGNVESPLEDGRERRSRHGVLPHDVDFNGAVADIPNVGYCEAGTRIPAE